MPPTAAHDTVSRTPLIGVTPSIDENKENTRLVVRCNADYLRCIADAGGVPVLLAPVPALARLYVESLDGFVFTGGPDINPERLPCQHPAHEELHECAKPMHALRQEFELALLEALKEQAPGRPVLGICLGMQMMGVHAGSRLIQHLPDILGEEAARQHKDGLHSIEPCGNGCPLHLPSDASSRKVTSSHHQAVDPAACLRVAAVAREKTPGGQPFALVEALWDPQRAWYVGVQWHPERTKDPELGAGVFRQLIAAARMYAAARARR